MRMLPKTEMAAMTTNNAEIKYVSKDGDDCELVFALLALRFSMLFISIL